jgi:hypothetical protein
MSVTTSRWTRGAARAIAEKTLEAMRYLLRIAILMMV